MTVEYILNNVKIFSDTDSPSSLFVPLKGDTIYLDDYDSDYRVIDRVYCPKYNNLMLKLEEL